MAGEPLSWWIYEKLARADQHIATLDTEVTRFLDTRPFQMTSEFKSNGDGTHTWIRRAQVKGFGEGTFALGDAVHNLRSTLNYLVTDLWIREGTEPDLWLAEFPIFLDRDDFESAGRLHIKGLPSAAQTVIADLQPFNRAKGSDPLWLLHYLDMIEKRQSITLSNYTLLDTAVLDLHSMTNVRLISSQIFSGMFEDGTVLAEAQLQYLGDVPEQQEACQDFPADVVLQGAGPATGLFAVPTLAQISEYIRIDVIPSLEPFATVRKQDQSRADTIVDEDRSFQMTGIDHLQRAEAAILLGPDAPPPHHSAGTEGPN